MPLDATPAPFLLSPRPAPGLPVARPRLPPAEAILPYLREIDRNGWYANHGALWQRLGSRLAAHWGMETGQVALTANATLGIALALRAAGAAAGRKCLMPAWTFVATAGAAREAGMVPHFADVSAAGWALEPEAVEARPDLAEIGAILVVAPFGRPVDAARWDALSARTGIPVVIDAAAAFDALRAGGPMAAGRAPVVVSLHATKSFGMGEGGAVLSRDAALLERLRRLSAFGFLGSREAVLPGTNAKMSEYAAAVGLAALDAWPETRAGWLAVTQRYAEALAGEGGATPSPGFGGDWIGATLSVLWPGRAEDGEAALAREGIGTLRWWGQGCHRHPAYAGCPRDPLPVTESLARRAIGLPFWRDMDAAGLDRVCAVVRRAAPVPYSPAREEARAGAGVISGAATTRSRPVRFAS